MRTKDADNCRNDAFILVDTFDQPDSEPADRHQLSVLHHLYEGSLK